MKNLLFAILGLAIVCSFNPAYGQDLQNTKETIIDLSSIYTGDADLIRFHIGSNYEVDTCNNHNIEGRVLPLEYGLDEVSIIVTIKTNGVVRSTSRVCMDSFETSQFLHFQAYESNIYDTKIKFVHPRNFEVKYTLVTESDLFDP